MSGRGDRVLPPIEPEVVIEPLPLTDALLDQLRDVAERTARGGVGGLPGAAYAGQGYVEVPSAWLAEIIGRLRHCQAAVDKPAEPAPPTMTAFERAQLRALALRHLGRDQLFWGSTVHPSFWRAADCLAAWYAAPYGEPLPHIYVGFIHGADKHDPSYLAAALGWKRRSDNYCDDPVGLY